MVNSSSCLRAILTQFRSRFGPGMNFLLVNRTRKLPSLLFWAGRAFVVACFLSLLSNVIYLTILYMRYETDSKVAPYIPITQESPKVSLCFEIQTILSPKPQESFFNQQVPTYSGQKVSSIFDKLPPVERVISHCSYRNFTSDQFISEKSASKCAQIFNVKRYRLQGYICYLLNFNGQVNNYSFYSITHSLSFQRQLFRVAIDKPLNEGHTIYPMIHFEDVPKDDRIFNQELIPSLTKNLSYQLSYDLYQLHRLKRPYETKCFQKSKLMCFNDCVEENFNRMGYSPSHGLVMDDESSKNLVLADYKGPGGSKLSKMWLAYKSICNRKCQSEACDQSLVITYTSRPIKSQNKLTFEVLTASNPVTKIKYVARILFFDFLTICFSLAGIWIEFSIFSLFTFTDRERVKKSKKLHQIHQQLIKLYVKFNGIVLKNAQFLSHSRDDAPCLVDKKKNSKKVFTIRLAIAVASKVAIYALLLFQVYNACKNYFSYETISKFYYDMSPVATVPTLSICLKLEDLFGRKVREATESSYHEYYVEKSSLYQMTRKEMFERTWTDEILFKCRVRDWTDFFSRVTLRNTSECLKEFEIVKYFASNKLCYQFLPKDAELTISQAKLKGLTMTPGKFYAIIVNPIVAKFEGIRLILSYDRTPPVFSKEFDAIAIRQDFNRLYVLSFLGRVRKFLPPPYDTRCSDKHTFYYVACYDDSVAKIGRLSHDILNPFPVPYKTLSYVDFLNSTVARYWKQLEIRCNKAVNYWPCVHKYSRTFISHSIDRSDFQLEFAVDAADHPTTTAISLPRTTLYDLYYQIAASLSFWVGFSFVALNPLRFYAQSRFKQVEKLLQLRSRKLERILLLFTRQEHSGQKNRHRINSKLMLEFIKSKKHLTCFFICFVGCFVQLIDSFETYFQYPTILYTKASLEDSTRYTLTLCLDLPEILDTFGWSSPRTMEDALNFSLKTSDILAMAPKENDFLASCGYFGLSKDLTNDLTKATDRLFFRQVDSERCNPLFNVTKRLFKGSICYDIEAYKLHCWNRHQMLHSLNRQKVLFMVGVDTSILTSSYSLTVRVRSDQARGVSWHSKIWSPPVTKITSPGTKYYMVSYLKYHQKILAPPFSDDGYTNILFVECVYRCFRDLRIERNLTAGHLLFPVIRNELIASCESNCSVNYSKLAATLEDIEYTVTVAREGRISRRHSVKDLTLFFIKSTDHEVITIEFKASNSLFEFFIQIGSIICIWFGLSVVQADPLATKSRLEHLTASVKASDELMDQIDKRCHQLYLMRIGNSSVQENNFE